MLFSLDIETEGLDPFKDEILVIGVYSAQMGYIAFKTLKEFQLWDQSQNHSYICHHGQFDINFMRRKGYDIGSKFVFDTRSTASILIPIPSISVGQRSALGLENLGMALLKREPYKLDRTKMASYSFEELEAYNKKDCQLTWDLYHYLRSHLADKDLVFVDEWVMPATRLCMRMEYQGFEVDTLGLKAFEEELLKEREEVVKNLYILTEEGRAAWKVQQIADLKERYHYLSTRNRKHVNSEERYRNLLERAIEKMKDFNFNSSIQLKWLLRDFYGLNLFNSRSEKETTDEAMLKSLESKSPVCKALLDFRRLEKMLSTAIPALTSHLHDSRIHPHFHIGGTRTGRLSSSHPNCQNIPRGRIRSYVRASKGYDLFVADYAQIEVRILAELAKEDVLIDAFKRSIDPYSLIAKSLFKLDCEVSELKALYPTHRNVAKTVGLSILYGTGPYKLSEVLEKELGMKLSYKEAREFILEYRASFPSIVRYKHDLERQMSNQKKYYNLMKRPTYIHTNEELYMKAMNTVVQGSASDLVVHAFGKICFEFPEIRPLMLIHDEMVMEIPENFKDVDRIEKIAINFPFDVPLKIETYRGKEWQKP